MSIEKIERELDKRGMDAAVQAALLSRNCDVYSSRTTLGLAIAAYLHEIGLSLDVSRLREALKPFADEATQWAGYDETEALVESWNGGPASQLRVCHLRAAARALSEREVQDG